MNNLLIVDGSALLSIIFFASVSDLMKITKDVDVIDEAIDGFFRKGHEHYTENVGSFISTIFGIKDALMASSMVIVFDKNSDSTFRKKLYPAYKATRTRNPAAIKDQMLVLHCILNKIGVKALWDNEYEADDLAGSIVCSMHDRFDNIYLFTRDRDWLQLLRPNVKAVIPMKDIKEAESFRTYYSDITENNPFSYGYPRVYGRNLCITQDICKDFYGVAPEQVIDLKGLAGDSSDNIPGIKGVGDEIARALLELFGGMDEVFENLSELSEDEFKSRTRVLIKRCPYKALKNGYDDARMSRKLATIVNNIDIMISTEELKVSIDRRNLNTAIRIYNLENDLDFLMKTQ